MVESSIRYSRQEYPLERFRYEIWLGQRKTGEDIGIAHSSLCCPLACYLTETYGAEFQVAWVDTVEDAWYERMDTMTKTPLPDWAKKEARFIDTTFKKGESIIIDQYWKAMNQRA